MRGSKLVRGFGVPRARVWCERLLGVWWREPVYRARPYATHPSHTVHSRQVGMGVVGPPVYTTTRCLVQVPRTSRALQPCRFCATGKLNALLSVGLSSFCAGRTRAPNRIKASSKHSLCAHRIKGSSKHSLCASSHERASHPEGDHRLGHSTSGWLSRIGSSMVQIPAKTPEASRLRPA